MAEAVNVRAQLVRLIGETDWRINLLFDDGSDMISEVSFETQDEARVALDAWCDANGVVTSTLH